MIFQEGCPDPLSPSPDPGMCYYYVGFFFQEDHVITHKRKEQFAKYDRFLKRFEHSKALDAALDVSHASPLLHRLFYPLTKWEGYSFGCVRPSIPSVHATDVDLGAFLVVWR